MAARCSANKKRRPLLKRRLHQQNQPEGKRQSLKNIRMSPRKTRLVARLLQGMPVAQAEAQLSFLAKRSAMPLLKLLRSAIANAKNNFSLAESGLIIKSMTVDE